MQSELPQTIAPLLRTYVLTIDRELPGLLVGFYLHGSIALGAFNPRSSDIDAVAVIRRRCTAADLATLKQIHDTVQERYPRPFLEVIYLQASDLGKEEDQVEPFPVFNGVAGTAKLTQNPDYCRKLTGECQTGSPP